MPPFADGAHYALTNRQCLYRESFCWSSKWLTGQGIRTGTPDLSEPQHPEKCWDGVDLFFGAEVRAFSPILATKKQFPTHQRIFWWPTTCASRRWPRRWWWTMGSWRSGPSRRRPLEGKVSITLLSNWRHTIITPFVTFWSHSEHHRHTFITLAFSSVFKCLTSTSLMAPHPESNKPLF